MLMSAESHQNDRKLQHVTCEETLRELSLLSLEKRKLWGVVIATFNAYEIFKKMEQGSSQMSRCVMGR